MITLDKVIIVEGKYDKIKLSSIIDAPIIETNGFRIFKDKEKRNLIRVISEKKDILVITDSDSAGFVIRNYLKNIIKGKKIYNAYIPQVIGKEKRKEKPSKEGTLGVEGLDEKLIMEAIRRSGAMCEYSEEKTDRIRKSDFYELGLVGREDSKNKRIQLLKKLNLPEYMSTNAMVEAFNVMYTVEDVEQMLNELEIQENE